jgi:uncharacterized protein (TIRG00374 family)
VGARRLERRRRSRVCHLVTDALLTAIPITPGGLGIVELGLTGALVAAGAGDAEAVATVLVYRALTWLPPILTGLPAIPLLEAPG